MSNPSHWTKRKHHPLQWWMVQFFSRRDVQIARKILKPSLWTHRFQLNLTFCRYFENAVFPYVTWQFRHLKGTAVLRKVFRKCIFTDFVVSDVQMASNIYRIYSPKKLLSILQTHTEAQKSRHPPQRQMLTILFWR